MHFIVIEYCEGGTLLQYVIDKGKKSKYPGLDEKEAMEFFSQILQGLCEIHQ